MTTASFSQKKTDPSNTRPKSRVSSCVYKGGLISLQTASLFPYTGGDHMSDHIFCCPRCGQKATIAVASKFGFLHRLDLPYYICSDCRVVYYDKQMTMEQVRQLRKIDSGARKVPFRTIYQAAKELLDKCMEHFCDQMDYRIVRFKKVKRDEKRST
jgi:hypothetical protein